MSKRQYQQRKPLIDAAIRLANAAENEGIPDLENALADVIAEGRLLTEKLKLDRRRMTDRVNARLAEDLA